MTEETTLTSVEGYSYGIGELTSLLAAKWGKDTPTERAEAFRGAMKRQSEDYNRRRRITEEDINKVNTNERIDMTKYDVEANLWGYKAPNPKSINHIEVEVPRCKKKELAPVKVTEDAPAKFFPLTPDFSEKEFEEFAGGAEHTVTFKNHHGSRTLITVTVKSIEGIPGDTVVNYKGSFAVLKGTHGHWKFRAELT